MNEKYKKLFEELRLNNGVILKNRFVLAPLTHVSSNEDGTISEVELPYIEKRSEDVGLALTAASNVAEEGKAFPGQPSIARDSDISGLTRLAEVMKKNGAKAVIQIHHGGVQALPELIEGEVFGPSDIEMKSFGQQHTHKARAMTEQEIEETIKAFGKATERAIAAGFDGVEIHGANGYIIHQFFSPHFNRRTDKWADSLAFPAAIVQEVLRVVNERADSDFIVGYRFSPEEMQTPGIKMELTKRLVEYLREQPLDYLHVSLMHIHGETHDGKYKGEQRIKLLKQWIDGKMPLIGVGSIFTPEDALAALETGVELIALGRELLLDYDFVGKLKNGREDEIISEFDSEDPEHHHLPEPLWQQFKAGFYPLPVKGK